MADPLRERTEVEIAREQAATRDREAQKIAALRTLRESTALHSELVTILLDTREVILEAQNLGGGDSLQTRALDLIEVNDVPGFIDFLLELFESNSRVHQVHRSLFAGTLAGMIKTLPKTKEEGRA